MTIGIHKNAKTTNLSYLDKIKKLFMSRIDFKTLQNTILSKDESECIANFLNFTTTIESKEKRQDFRKEIICKPSNLARLLGFDVICNDLNFTDDCPEEYLYVDYVVLNRSKTCVIDSEAQLFQDEYKKSIIDKQSSEK